MPHTKDTKRFFCTRHDMQTDNVAAIDAHLAATGHSYIDRLLQVAHTIPTNKLAEMVVAEGMDQFIL